MDDISRDEAEERQIEMLAHSLLHWLDKEHYKVNHVTIRGLLFAVAWCVAQLHFHREMTDVERSVEVLADELRIRIPVLIKNLREV